MKFVQIIEFTTTKADEIEPIFEEWLAATEGQRTATRGVMTQDRDQPNTYLNIVEFPSYEEAMKNSNLPATAVIAQKMMALSDSVVFRNLDVVREDSM